MIFDIAAALNKPNAIHTIGKETAEKEQGGKGNAESGSMGKTGEKLMLTTKRYFIRIKNTHPPPHTHPTLKKTTLTIRPVFVCVWIQSVVIG